MASTAKPHATYADLLALPDNVTGELINGNLIASPQPAGPHVYTASVIGMDIGTPFQRGRGGPGGWLILSEPELHIADDVLVPDLAGWRVERMSRVPDDHRFIVVPDWVCEVLSPSTARTDRLLKMDIYARAGVKHAWLVSPIERLLEVYTLQHGTWLRDQVFGADTHDLIRAVPFDAVELQLSAFWSNDSPQP